MRVWPGEPYPLGRRSTARGPTSRCSPRWPSGSSSACSTPAARRRGSSCPRSPPSCWHGYLPNVVPGPALRLPRPRAVGPRRRASAAIPPSSCSTPTPRRSRARCGGTRPSSPTASSDPDGSPQRRSTARRSCPSRVVTNPFFDWGNDRPPRIADARHGDLRGPRQGLHPAPPGHPRGAARHLRRPAHPAAIDHLKRLGVTAVELLPVHQFVQDSLPARARACATTGATTRSATSRRTTSTPLPAAPRASRCRSSSRW